MNLIEDILSHRELTIFIGVENHSAPYTPLLFNNIWPIVDNMPSKDLLIIPIEGLKKPYRYSKEKIMCYGRALWVLFVDSIFCLHNAFLFDSFSQTDENNYFDVECIHFLQKSNCRVVTVCDMGIYRARSLMNLLNSAISALATYNISVCLATILGYNLRGATDIELGNEKELYQKAYYLNADIETTVLSDKFDFIQIDKKFNLSDVSLISNKIKSPAEIVLQQINQKAQPFKSLKDLLDIGAVQIILNSCDKGKNFDFITFNHYLREWKFKGNLIDKEWDSIYEKLCKKIKEANQIDRKDCVQELISEIGNNINTTINYIKSI